MSFDRIRKRLFKNEFDFDMFQNDDSDNCKDKYNNLIYLLIKIIEAPKNSIIERFDLHKYTSLIEENKDTVLLFLYLVQDVLTNQSIDTSKLDSEDISYITDLNGNLDLNTLSGKNIIINQIRNAYAHKSGKIFFYEDNGIKKVKIDNKAWFSIEANLDQLNKLFENITIVDNSNDIQNDINNTIECIKKGRYNNIPTDTSTILKLNLLMCYNKESIFDRFMQTQTSYIDASNFHVNTTVNWNCTEDNLRRKFFDKYDIFFHSDTDKQSYENEWQPIVDITNNTVALGTKYSYNIKNMPLDNYTQKHIPIPIFLIALRDANSHGRIYKRDDKYIFYDQENQTGSLPYFYMEIDKERLKEFLSQDYFEESILTTINEHQNNYINGLYLMEQAESANKFSNYVDIYKTRMSGLTEFEVIKYMYDNNKFSSYLLEYPDQVEDFMHYKLLDGRNLLFVLNQFDNIKTDEYKLKKDLTKYYSIGISLYKEVLEDELKTLIDCDKSYFFDKNSYSYKLNKNYDFFNIYYSFIRNLRDTNPNISFKTLYELSDDERRIIEAGSEELKEEYCNNGVVLQVKNENTKRIFTEIGIQQSRKKEICKIQAACVIGNYRKKEEKENESIKRYKITNVEKRSTLSKSFSNSLEHDIDKKSNYKRNLALNIYINLGLRAINNLYFDYIITKPIASNPLFQDLFFFTYTTAMFFNYIQIGKSMIGMHSLEKSVKNDVKNIVNYYDGGDDGEFGNTGYNHIK